MLPRFKKLLFTPASIVSALLAAEVVLVLSEQFRLFSFNRHKGWTVLICLTIVAAALLLLAIWFVIARIFHRRFQFNIRSLLILTLVVAMACGWMTIAMQKATSQAGLAAEAAKVGCSILYNYNITDSGNVAFFTGALPGETRWNKLLGDDFFREIAGAFAKTDAALQSLKDQTSIHKLFCNDSSISDTGMESLQHLKRLEWLDLRDASGVTDAGLKHLAGLTHLRELLLRRTGVGDAGMVYLKNLKQLEVLDLGMTRVTHVGLQQLAGLTRLRQLEFWGNNIEDAGLSAIEPMTQLETLDLGFAPVTDVGLEKLKGLTHLRSLGLRGSRITDAGLRHLDGLRQLWRLDLYKTQISDAGLEHLVHLSHLEELHLGETQVTPAGIKQLQHALPNCKIAQ